MKSFKLYLKYFIADIVIYYLDYDNLIESVFEVCDKQDQGLTLKELKEKSCMNHLTSLFGMLDDNVAEDFKSVDENGDGIVSKQESIDAFENLIGLDRSTSHKFNMQDDNGVLESDKKRIITWAKRLVNKNKNTLGSFLDAGDVEKIATGMVNDLEENIGGNWLCSFGNAFYIHGFTTSGPGTSFWLYYTKGDYKMFCYKKVNGFEAFLQRVRWGFCGDENNLPSTLQALL